MDPQPLISEAVDKSVLNLSLSMYPLKLGKIYVLLYKISDRNKKKIEFFHRRRRRFCDKKLFDKIV